MKLYRYFEDCGRMGAIEGLFFSNPEELAKLQEHHLYWFDLLGKHSEGFYDFSKDCVEEINIPEEAAAILYEVMGKVISGPFDFDYFEEYITESEEQ